MLQLQVQALTFFYTTKTVLSIIKPKACLLTLFYINTLGPIRQEITATITAIGALHYIALIIHPTYEAQLPLRLFYQIQLIRPTDS